MYNETTSLVWRGTLANSNKHHLDAKVLCKFKLPPWSLLSFSSCEGWNQSSAHGTDLSLSCMQDAGLNLNSAIPGWIRRGLRFRLSASDSCLSNERGEGNFLSKRSSHTRLSESLSWQEICCHAHSSSGTLSAQLLWRGRLCVSRLRTSYLGVEGDSMICRRRMERGRVGRTVAGFIGGNVQK